MLVEYWSQHTRHGFHHEDEPFITEDRILRWTVDDALGHKKAFDTRLDLHNKLHANLFAHPFVGDLRQASVFILFGNPGFVPTDYSDEHHHLSHKAACVANLAGRGAGLFVLGNQSQGTGAYDYWTPRFQRIVKELTVRLSVHLEEARSLVMRHVALIEAGAYHSKSSPGHWLNNLPSSQMAQRYVNQQLLPRAKNGEVLIFVWRRAAFWGVSTNGTGVLLRPSKQAQLSYMKAEEREAIVSHICAVSDRD